jgi:hypothetical protein
MLSVRHHLLVRRISNVITRNIGAYTSPVKTKRIALPSEDQKINIEYEVQNLFPTNKNYFQNREKKILTPLEYFAKMKGGRSFFGVQLIATTNPLSNLNSQVKAICSADPLQQMVHINVAENVPEIVKRGRPWDIVCSVYGFRNKAEALLFEHFWNWPLKVDSNSLRRVMVKHMNRDFTNTLSYSPQDQLHGTAAQTIYLKRMLTVACELLTHPESPFYRSINGNKTPVTGPLHFRLFSPEYYKLALDMNCPLHLFQTFKIQSQQEMMNAPQHETVEEAIAQLYPKTPETDPRSVPPAARDHSTTQFQVASLPPWFGKLLVEKAQKSAQLAQQRYSLEKKLMRQQRYAKSPLKERQIKRAKGKI